MPFPVEMKWIIATQKKLGVTFPAALATALSKCNRGTIQTETDSCRCFRSWMAPIENVLPEPAIASIAKPSQSATDGSGFRRMRLPSQVAWEAIL